MSTMNSSLVHHIAALATIPVTPEEEVKLAAGFETTLAVVDKLMSVDTTGVEPTHQVTGLQNVLRDDVVIEANMFTQKQALANAKQTYNGYFVVPLLVEE